MKKKNEGIKKRRRPRRSYISKRVENPSLTVKLKAFGWNHNSTFMLSTGMKLHANKRFEGSIA
ncbi:hypothetical protein NC652_031088 [Populus alba x Populus x berolinensis]|nr:hypothetical protein NC652_031088 [Populus alba x Populus x berolinensis]